MVDSNKALGVTKEDIRRERIRNAREVLKARAHEEVALAIAEKLVAFECHELKRIEARVRELLGVAD